MESKDIKKEESLKKYKEVKDPGKLSKEELTSELSSILGEDVNNLKINKFYGRAFIESKLGDYKKSKKHLRQVASKLTEEGYACYDIVGEIRIEKETNEMRKVFESSKVAKDMRDFYRHTSADASVYFDSDFANSQLKNLAEEGYAISSYVRDTKKIQKALEKRGYSSHVLKNYDVFRIVVDDMPSNEKVDDKRITELKSNNKLVSLMSTLKEANYQEYEIFKILSRHPEFNQETTPEEVHRVMKQLNS